MNLLTTLVLTITTGGIIVAGNQPLLHQKYVHDAEPENGDESTEVLYRKRNLHLQKVGAAI